jgi:type-F conjugative transfer system pilin assembly protein TrbC
LFAGQAFAATGYIDTPDECYFVAKETGQDVYLEASGPWEGHPGRAYVEASGWVKVHVGGTLWKEEEATGLSIPDIKASLENSQDMARTLVIPVNPNKVEMEKEAGRLKDIFLSPGFQEKVMKETERLKGEVFKKPLEDYYTDDKKGWVKKDAAGVLPRDERVYLFISSSMPMATIRNYIASVARLKDRNITVVLRGFIAGMKKIGPTIRFIALALTVDPLCSRAGCEMYSVSMVVDPLLFRRYDIAQVPAVVHARGVRPSLPEESEGLSATSVNSSTTVYGDASLEYILDLIRRETGAKSLACLLAKH